MVSVNSSLAIRSPGHSLPARSNQPRLHREDLDAAGTAVELGPPCDYRIIGGAVLAGSERRQNRMCKYRWDNRIVADGLGPHHVGRRGIEIFVAEFNSVVSGT